MTYTVNFRKIATDNSSSSLARRTAAQILLNGGYMNVGDWLKSLSTIELIDLCGLAETVMECTDETAMITHGTPEYTALTEFVLLGTMLTAAEGDSDVTDDTVDKNSKAIMLLCITEGMYRKGLIELLHDKISFSSNEKIAKLKD